MESVRITRVLTLSDMKLLIIFNNGVCKIYDGQRLLRFGPAYSILKDPEVFRSVKISGGGFGIFWNEDVDTSEWDLWDNGEKIPLTEADINHIYCSNIVSTTESARILNRPKYI